ncbi:MAG: carbohydrate ABC transporter permease [Actinomycetota bacterium]|nr:carbohydrate ABC transporter permease [Actinomycetota bacterium]
MSTAASPRDVVAELRARARAGEIEQIRHPRVTIGGLSSNALLALLGAAFFLPLIWVLFASLDANAGAGVRIPDLSLVHYRAMGHESRLRPLYNSFYLAGISTLISTLTGLFAGYALSRRHIPFKRTLMLIVLFMSGLPVTMLLVPTYQMFVRLNWIDSLWWTSMFIAASSLPFTIWLLKNFIDQVPRELEEAAAIEGTRNFEIVVRVVVPLALPGILVTSLVAFINAWGAFVIPLVLNSNPNDTPGSIAIYQFLTENGQIHFGDLAAYSILFAVPVVVLYLIASRRISGAFTFAGGIKQ